MTCPHCGSLNLVKHTPTAAGSLRYRCKDCGKVYTLNKKRRGRKPIGDRAMTEAEKKRRQRGKG